MKIKIPFYILLFLSFAANAQLINWQFAKHIGGSGSDGCAKICNDKNGNTIFAGNSSSSSVTIDNLSFYNPAPSYPSSIILAKYDSTGNVMWAKNYPGSSGGYKAVNSVALDSADNILITGTFSGGSLVIDTITLLSKGYSDIFTAKFDPSGNVLWARNFGGWFYNYGMSITADVHNDVLLAGYFYSDTLKMDTITILNPNMGCFGDVIVAKLNSATGNVIWAKRAGGYGKDIANCIKTDKWGNVYVADESQVSTPMNFDSINVSAAGVVGRGRA